VEQVLQKSKPMDEDPQEINCGYCTTGGGTVEHIKQLVEALRVWIQE
jgi:hypothetical protein